MPRTGCLIAFGQEYLRRTHGIWARIPGPWRRRRALQTGARRVQRSL